jgi:hypothetical protein
MRNRISLFVSVVLAGAALAATLAHAAPEADECLARPKGVAPAGKHWYYNTDRKLQRKCWYLDDAGEKTVAVAPRKQPAAVSPAPPKREAAEQPQNVDARAELVEEPREEPPVAPIPSLAPLIQPQLQESQNASDAANKRDWTVASRWPEPSDTFAPSPAPRVADSASVRPSEQPSATMAPVQMVQSPEATESAGDLDFGLIAAGLILLVVVGGTIMIVSRRNHSNQDRPLRRIADRDEMAWPPRPTARPAFANRIPDTVSRSDVIEEVEQLVTARRQRRESRALP